MLLVLGGGLLGAGGCTAPEAESRMTLSRPEQMALYNRALDLLVTAASSERDAVTCNAIEALVRVSPADGKEAFRDALDSDSPRVRYAGLVALGQTRQCAPIEAIRAAIRDPHPLVRLAAAYAAVRCGYEGPARILVQTLNDAPEERLRADAATLIGRLEESRAAKRLEAALRSPANERSSRVTIAIYGALARLGDEEGVRKLVFYSCGGAADRTEALLILADLDNLAFRDDLLYALAGPEEEYLEARLIAARGLGRLGFDDGYVLALDMIDYTDPDSSPTDPDRTFAVRSLAIHALAEIGDPRALEPLRAIAADQSDPRLQVAASYAICRIIQKHGTVPGAG